MRLKLEISPDLVSKFEEMLAKQIGDNVWGAKIEDIGTQYEFRFRMYGSDWRFELDKNPNGAWYTLHCSSQELYLPIDLIKDLKLFCQQILRIKQMQTDFINSK
ncbi:MAG: hypothetical protein EBS55_13130 [Flavobacteriaceae bacterium]|nr:hypothetical protein [Flavobacteriaceae bacterium]